MLDFCFEYEEILKALEAGPAGPQAERPVRRCVPAGDGELRELRVLSAISGDELARVPRAVPSVLAAKLLVEEARGIPVHEQRLLAGGRVLRDAEPLSGMDSAVQLVRSPPPAGEVVLRVVGGVPWESVLLAPGAPLPVLACFPLAASSSLSEVKAAVECAVGLPAHGTQLYFGRRRWADHRCGLQQLLDSLQLERCPVELSALLADPLLVRDSEASASQSISAKDLLL